MIVRLTPEYKFVCDRCGKEEFPDEEGYIEDRSVVSFVDRTRFKHKEKEGQVCLECLAEFWEIANNFFDEVNKERSEK